MYSISFFSSYTCGVFVKDAYEVERSIASERKTIWEVVVSL